LRFWLTCLWRLLLAAILKKDVANGFSCQVLSFLVQITGPTADKILAKATAGFEAL